MTNVSFLERWAEAVGGTPEEVLERVLEIAMDPLSLQTPYVELDRLLREAGARPARLGTGVFLARTGEPVRQAMILLRGDCSVSKYSSQGKGILTGTAAAPQVFGLYELLAGVECHTANVQAVEDCLLVRARGEVLLSCLRGSKKAAWNALLALAGFIGRALERSDKLSLNSPRQNLLLYLYGSCQGKLPPVVIAARKSDIAMELALNQRTLYRMLDALCGEGLVSRQRGKLVVDAAQLAAIREEVAELLE